MKSPNEALEFFIESLELETDMRFNMGTWYKF